MENLSAPAETLFNAIPVEKAIGNVTLRKIMPETFDAAKEELLAAGLIKIGRGKGGSVRRVQPQNQSIDF